MTSGRAKNCHFCFWAISRLSSTADENCVDRIHHFQSPKKEEIFSGFCKNLFSLLNDSCTKEQIQCLFPKVAKDILSFEKLHCIGMIFLELVTYFLREVPLPITNQNPMNPASLVLRVKKHQSKSVIKIFLSSFLPYFVDGWEVIGLKKPLGIL